MIKPGSICYIVPIDANTKQFQGHVVEALSPYLEDFPCHGCGGRNYWNVRADFVAWREPVACQCILRPIDDPDEPASIWRDHQTPEALTA